MHEAESRKTVSRCESNASRFFERSRLLHRFHITWGCTGFDAVIGRIGLRVRALFPLINEQTKLNATDNVVVADFSRAAARRAA